MPLPTIKGSLQPLLQKYSGKYSPSTGFTYDQEFKGLSPALMQSLANTYANAGCSYVLDVNYGVASLKTTDNRGEVTIDTWEINANETLISTFKNPRNVAAISARNLAYIAYAFETGFETATDTGFNSSNLQKIYGTFTYPVYDSGSAFWRLLERVSLFKEDSTFYDMYTVRHTTNVSNRYLYNIADTNKNCIYTPAQFYAEAQSSSYWIFPMPEAFVNVLNANTAPSPPPALFANHGYYLWGFLKGASGRVTAANNRTNITTEYKQFLWSTDEYSTV